MPACAKLMEPSRDDLTRWFKKARHGDRCQVVTKQGTVYTQLTKLSPSRVKWQVSGFNGHDIDLSNSMPFSELAATWDEIAIIS